MTRWSTPSKRPQTRMAPGPALSAAIRACVSGTPRGDNMSRGRSSFAVASMARPSTSGFITMPGPPPAGVSSTERCLSVANERISATSSAQAPAASALPARLKPKGPGNMSGKIVSTLARHMLLAPYRGFDNQTPRREIDVKHSHGIERKELCRRVFRRLHLDQVACAEIMHGDHGAELPAGAIDNGKTDQIGMIILVGLFRLRQPFARHIEFCIGEAFGGAAIGNAGKRRNEIILRRPQGSDFEHAAVLAFERAVIGNRRRIG